MSRTLNLVSEVKNAIRSDLRSNLSVDLSCIAIKRDKYRRNNVTSVRLEVTDETGEGVAVFRENQCQTTDWEHVVSIRAGDPIRLKGFVDYKTKGADILGQTVRKVAASNIGPALKDAVSSTTQLYVARIKAELAKSLREDDFTEIDTRLISSAPPPDGSVYPLKVRYEGYGGRFHIASTPVPQLIRFASRTSFGRLFAISRSFTQTYRDPVASVESVIVSVFERSVSLEDLLYRQNQRIFAVLAKHAPNELPERFNIPPASRRFQALSEAGTLGPIFEL
jgi:hypothetical protein